MSVKLKINKKQLILLLAAALIIGSVGSYFVVKANRNSSKSLPACICGPAGGVSNEPCKLPTGSMCL
jgi:predicted neutral ceramidase superfamily lipid hydrolase